MSGIKVIYRYIKKNIHNIVKPEYKRKVVSLYILNIKKYNDSMKNLVKISIF